MRMISAGLVVLALVAAEPAFAGCGSHGGGYRTRVVRSPIVVKKVVKVVQKREPQSSVRTAATTTADKPEATPRVESSTSTAVAESSPAKTVQTPKIECKEYSAAVGEMITVPCS